MKTLLKYAIIALLAFFVQINSMQAQKGHGHGHNKKVIVKNKSYNNKTVVVVKNKPNHYHKYHPHYYHRRVYHPVWGPPVGFHRRWVFFPRYNFYWDNYNSMYVYWGGSAWVRTVSPPPTIININITNEKKYELKDSDDTVDDIYDGNDNHKKEYPES